MTSICGDYPCGEEILDILYNCKVTDSANGSSHNNAGSALIRCEALGRPACNSSSEEQCWFPTLGQFLLLWCFQDFIALLSFYLESSCSPP